MSSASIFFVSEASMQDLRVENMAMMFPLGRHEDALGLGACWLCPQLIEVECPRDTSRSPHGKERAATLPRGQ